MSRDSIDSRLVAARAPLDSLVSNSALKPDSPAAAAVDLPIATFSRHEAGSPLRTELTSGPETSQAKPWHDAALMAWLSQATTSTATGRELADSDSLAIQARDSDDSIFDRAFAMLADHALLTALYD
jgi:hypothetical protein